MKMLKELKGHTVRYFRTLTLKKSIKDLFQFASFLRLLKFVIGIVTSFLDFYFFKEKGSDGLFKKCIY